MKLYAKDNILCLIETMIKNDRLSHSFILCGEKGIGKKTLAHHLAKQILCQKGNGKACGVCKSCRMAENNAHPDLITLSPSGKSGNFKADDLRPIISDATVTANEGIYKVYILPDFDKAQAVAQNIMLKVVEEPPKNVIFIMTATSREGILQTVLSRSITLSLENAKPDEAIDAIVDSGYPIDEAKKAVETVGTNIGACLDFLSSDKDGTPYDSVKSIADAIIKADKYLLLKELSSLDKDRALCLSVLSLLEGVVRDAIVSKSGGKLNSCCKEEAQKIGEYSRQGGLLKMYEAIEDSVKKINGNSNSVLTLSDLSCKLIKYSRQ